MKVAITGGTGCMGRPLLRRLKNEGHDISLLVSPGESLAEELKDVKIVTGDIRDKKALDAIVVGAETIFHLAAKVHDSGPWIDAILEEYKEINVEGTKGLVSSAVKSGVKRIVFYSTVGVYGKESDFCGDETSACFPVTPYAKSKLEAENIVIDSAGKGGPEGVVLRFPVAYGPYDRGNIARFIQVVKKGRFVYFGDGLAPRSMISSSNAAEAAFIAGVHPQAAGNIYCVTDSIDHSVRALVEVVLDTFEVRNKPVRIPLKVAQLAGKVGDIIKSSIFKGFPVTSTVIAKLSKPLTFSCDKIKRELGYSPSDRFKEDIRAEIEWLFSKRLKQ